MSNPLKNKRFWKGFLERAMFYIGLWIFFLPWTQAVWATALIIGIELVSEIAYLSLFSEEAS